MNALRGLAARAKVIGNLYMVAESDVPRAFSIGDGICVGLNAFGKTKKAAFA